jgi:ABC-type bacteriocin/lantibiotic exporter with double-glycine peptidase domain
VRIVDALDGVESAKRRIQEAIDALHGGITIVVITHRLSTIRNADVIHVIEDGRIIESGPLKSCAVVVAFISSAPGGTRIV